MKSELKAKWLEALRSGKYEQAKGCLRKDDRYCCLGVLCDVVDPSGWELIGNTYKYLGYLSFLPPEVANIGYEDALVGMNDGKGKSFPEIADWIEANIETTDN